MMEIVKWVILVIWMLVLMIPLLLSAIAYSISGNVVWYIIGLISLGYITFFVILTEYVRVHFKIDSEKKRISDNKEVIK